MFQQQHRRAHQGNRVGQALARQVRGAAVDSLEYCDLGADVCSRHQPETPDQARTQVADNVSEKVLHDQHVEIRRVERQPQRKGVDLQLVETQKRIIVGHLPGGRQEQTVAHWQHVSLVAKSDLVPALVPSQFKGEAHDPFASRLRDDPQAFDDAWNHNVFLSGVQAFGVLRARR